MSIKNTFTKAKLILYREYNAAKLTFKASFLYNKGSYTEVTSGMGVHVGANQVPMNSISGGEAQFVKGILSCIGDRTDTLFAVINDRAEWLAQSSICNHAEFSNLVIVNLRHLTEHQLKVAWLVGYAAGVHEAVHVEQHTRGRLQHPHGETIWEDESYVFDYTTFGTDYLIAPWEVEARYAVALTFSKITSFKALELEAYTGGDVVGSDAEDLYQRVLLVVEELGLPPLP